MLLVSTVYLNVSFDPPVHSVGTMPYNTSSIFIVCATSVRVRVISLIVTVDNRLWIMKIGS